MLDSLLLDLDLELEVELNLGPFFGFFHCSSGIAFDLYVRREVPFAKATSCK